MILIMKLEQNSKQEEEYLLHLESKMISEKEMNNILIDEIKELKKKIYFNKDYSERNREKEEDLNSLENELKILDEEINKMLIRKEEIKQKINNKKNDL